MEREEAVLLHKEGRIGEWNQRRGSGEKYRLIEADLRQADLRGANLQSVKLFGADLRGADLRDANLVGARLGQTQLHGANLSAANLVAAFLGTADFSGADLNRASLSAADLSEAKLVGANLVGADLRRATLIRADLSEANLTETTVGWTILSGVDLSKVRGLETIFHDGPSDIGIQTLMRSKGRIPESFLQGCGFAPWEILNARLYDPNLTPHEITETQYAVFDKRAHGPLFIGGIFISYSWKDAKCVNKLDERFIEEEASVWLDRHDMVAGSLQKQVYRAIRFNDIVLLVLSESAIQSDWVGNELEMARKKEKEENRDVLCPIALDNSWRSKLDLNESDRALWRTLTKKNVLDFSTWNTEAFEREYQNLVTGLKIYYPPADRSSRDGTAQRS